MIKLISGKIDITPNFGVRLTGMNDSQLNIGIYSCLEINFIILTQNKLKIFIFSIDTLFITSDIKDCIIKNLKNRFENVSEDNVVIISSHTHFAPSLEVNRTNLGKLDFAYLTFLKERITFLINSINLNQSKNINISIGEGKTESLTNSRRRRIRRIRNFFRSEIAMEPNEKGFKHEQIKIIKFLDRDNKDDLLSVIWSFPCHPTNFFDNKLISSEFPGEIRNSIRQKSDNENLTILYLPGFAGDVRASPPREKCLSRKVRSLLDISYPVSFYRFQNEKQYISWVKKIELNFFYIWNKSELIDLSRNVLYSKLIKKETSLLGIKVPETDHIYIRKIEILKTFEIYLISAEVVSKYSLLFENIKSSKIIFYSGYNDLTFGYLPTDEQVKEGGYESKDYFKNFLVEGNFIPNIEKTIEQWIQEVK